MSDIILKPCRRCKCGFPLESFPAYVQKSGRQKGRLVRTYLCKPCQKANSAEIYLANKEEHKEKMKSYCLLNKDKIKERNKNDFQKNKEKHYERKRKWKKENREKYLLQKKRHKNLPHNRIKRTLKNRIKRLLNGEREADSSVGCDSKTLISALESKFQLGMTWQNYGWGVGKWVIDHIKPLSTFNLLDKRERYAANHYQNLQPLWYHQNEAKSGNYDPDHPMGWRGLDELIGG